MPTVVKARVTSTLKATDHPYRSGAWTPNTVEWDALDLQVLEGQIPLDLDGVYIRNTENPVHEAIGKYHPFDGDAMLHSIRFRRGHADYRNRFVPTKGFLAEKDAGHALWAGLAEHPRKSAEPRRNGNFPGAQGSLKDASSTDVVVHAGRVLSLFYQCGDVYSACPETLEPMGTETFGGRFPEDGVSAHAKVDERTDELLFFNYSKNAPYMHYGVVSKSRELVHYVPVPLPGPRSPHDMCFTERYSILCDFPLFWDPELLKKGVHATRFYPNIPSRFAVIPRYGHTHDIRWFEASPTFVLHFLNAYEEGDEIILDGYRQDDPMPASDQPFTPDAPDKYRRMMVYLTMSAMKPRLTRWRFNLVTGGTSEECLNPRVGLEFGVFNQRFAGRKYRFAYSAVSKPGWFLFTGLVKHDLETGSSIEVSFGHNRFGSEAPFAPRVGAKDEDDGYLVTFITDMERDQSECVLYDAKHLLDGPVCRLLLPHRISSGTHACWTGGERLGNSTVNTKLGDARIQCHARL